MKENVVSRRTLDTSSFVDSHRLKSQYSYLAVTTPSISEGLANFLRASAVALSGLEQPTELFAVLPCK